MKKSKLLALPLVMAMTACNNPAPAGFSTKVELPAGGTEVTTAEESKSTYKADLKSFIDGIANSLLQDSIKLSLDIDVNAKGIPFGEDTTGNASLKLQADAYFNIPETQEEYASAYLDIKDLSLTVSEIPNIGAISVSGLKLNAYYYVSEDSAKVYLDISDPSVKENLVPVLQKVVDYFLSLDPSQQIQIDVEQMYNTFFAGGKAIYTVPEVTIDEQSGTTTIDPLGYYLYTAKAGLPFIFSLINIDDIMAQLDENAPSLFEYKDSSGKVNRVGVTVERDVVEEMGNIEQAAEYQNTFSKGTAGVGLLVGNTTGSTNALALEYLGVKLDATTANPEVDVQGSAEVNVSYNEQAQFNPLTEEEAAEYTIDINAIIELIKMIINAGGPLG